MTGTKSSFSIRPYRRRRPRRLGSRLAGRRMPGVRVVLHEMRPDRMTEAHRTDGLAELVCSNSFRSDDAANNAVGLLHAEMRRLGSLIMRAADANQVPAGGALAVDRDGFSGSRHQGLARPSPDRAAARRNRRPAAGGLGQRHRRDRPPHLGAAGRRHSRTDRRERAGVLRRHRADRAPGFHRHVGGVVSVALRQGRPRRHRRRLHQLPDDKGAI